MGLDPSAVWDFAAELVGSVRGGSRRTTATVTRVDPDGTTWVTTGDGGEAPATSVAAGVSVGDTVTLEWDGSAMGIRSNVSNPSPAGSVIRRAVERTRSVADAAQRVADAVNQHFFADGNGIHVTEATQDEWDASHSGANVLINSIGQLFRDGLNNLLTLTTQDGARALTIWDGLGNAASNVRAVFGEVITLGNASDGSVVTIDSDSMDMVHGATKMLHFGYGEGASMSGTAVAPYYTIGIRTSTTGVGNYSLVEGVANTASSAYSHAEGYSSTASGTVSHAEGSGTASGSYSHAEGFSTVSSGDGAHAEGQRATASGNASHAEGEGTTASGGDSHAEGYSSTASGLRSHAQNRDTIASGENQTALGRWNVSDASGTYAVIVGNGTSDSSRSNALTVDWDGNVECAGMLSAAYTEDTCTVNSTNATIAGNVNHCWHNGVVCTITITVNLKASMANNNLLEVATAPSGYRPPHTFYGSAYVTGQTVNLQTRIDEDGKIYVNNRSGTSVTTSATIYLSFTFVP